MYNYNRTYHRAQARLMLVLGLGVAAMAVALAAAVDLRVHELLQRITEAL